MSNTLDIRYLTTKDVDDFRTIRLLALKTCPAAFGSMYEIEANKSMEEFADRLESSIVLGGFVHDQIVGMVGFKQDESPKGSHKGHVWGCYVDPSVQGLGIGTLLLNALIEMVRDSVEQLTLSVVTQNEAAIRLYKRMGFAVYGIEPRALKDAAGHYSDDTLMVMFLK